MKIHKYPGFFIDIEGLDGSGSSTQVRWVNKELEELGINPYLTSEPSNGPIGNLARSALKGEFDSLPPASIQLLFAADRGQHLEKEIIPRLKKGEMVITDRYAWSSIAYGSIDLPQTWLFDLNKDFILPDLSIFLEVAPDVCLERIAKENKGVELFEEEEKLEQAWSTYHSLASKYWWAQIILINGGSQRSKVTQEILSIISRQPKFRKIARRGSDR